MMPSRDELLRQAKDLGLPVTSGIYNPAKEAVTEIETTDYELLRRIREEERHRRDGKLWIVAAVAPEDVKRKLDRRLRY
jgi:hypothetical protein